MIEAQKGCQGDHVYRVPRGPVSVKVNWRGFYWLLILYYRDQRPPGNEVCVGRACCAGGHDPGVGPGRGGVPPGPV